MQWSSILIALLSSSVQAGALRPDPVKRQATPTSPAKYQDGIACNCNKYHVVVDKDTCSTIVQANNNAFTLNDLYRWNPGVGPTCASLWLGYSVCIGVDTAVTKCISTTSMTSSTLKTSTYPSTSNPTTSPLPLYSFISTTPIGPQPIATEFPTAGVPQPVLPGTYSSCQTYYQAQQGDNCASIVDNFFGFNQAQFIAWNPSVSYDCSSFRTGYYYCVQPQSYSPEPAVFSGPDLPSPLPNCTVSNCTAWYLAQDPDDCVSVPQTFGNLTFVDFLQWNPSILSANCTGFTWGYYYCINWPWAGSNNDTNYDSIDYDNWMFPDSTCDTDTTNVTSAAPVTTPTPVLTPPAQLPNGTSPYCTGYYTVQTGDTCNSVENYFGLNFGQLLSWNPSIGPDCEYLVIGNTYCVRPPVVPSTTVSFPQPTNTAFTQPQQSGVVGNCANFYFVTSDDNCETIEKMFGITDAQFRSWNAFIDTQCTNLWAGYYCCVGAVNNGGT